MTAVEDTPPDEYAASAYRMPWDEIAEQSLLGALMLSQDARLSVIGGGLVEASDFYRPAHEDVFAVITDLDRAGARPDPTLVASELARRGILAKVGGHLYIHTLYTAPASSANATFYAREVREMSVLRGVITAGTKVSQLGRASDGRDADTILAAARAEIEAVHSVGRVDAARDIGDILADIGARLASNEPDTSTRWEWPWMDFREGGDGLPFVQPATPGQMIVIAGRPAQGKSTALAAAMRQWCLHDDAVGVLWTKEMPEEQWMLRILSAEARVPLKRLKSRQVWAEEWDRIHAASARIEARRKQLIIIREGGTLGDIAAAQRKYKADVVGFDYIQIAPVGHAKSQGDRGMLIGEWTQGFKDLARDRGFVALTAAQLNRGNVSSGKPQPPTMENLRESGAIEQAADVVILIHREDCYDKESPRAGEADFIVAKQRDGETGLATLASQLHVCRFADMAH